MVFKHVNHCHGDDGGVHDHGVTDELCLLPIKIWCAITDDAIDFNPWIISRIYVDDCRLQYSKTT